MNCVLAVALMCAGCYLIGGIPFGYLIGRMKGIDIRTVGSRNIGATNVSRNFGKKWGIACFVLDVAKGLGPTLAAGHILASRTEAWNLSPVARNLLWLGCGICCVLGHNYSVYLRFRGGKGAATSLGVVLGVYPYLTLAGGLAFCVWAIVVLATRYVSLGSIVAAALLPPLAVMCSVWRGYGSLRDIWPVIAFAALAAVLVVYRHRENISRLRAGTERRIGEKR